MVWVTKIKGWRCLSVVFQPGLAVGLVVRGADGWADGVVTALPDHGGVAHVYGLVKRLQDRNNAVLLQVIVMIIG